MMSVRVTSDGKPRLRNGMAALVTAGAAASGGGNSALSALNTAMIGQSNMVHLSDEFGDVHYFATGPLSQRWARGAFSQIGWYDPTGHVAAGTPYSAWGNTSYASGMVHNAEGGDGITTLVNQLTAAAPVSITTFEYAVIGSSIQRWQTGGDCWTAFHDAVIASGRTLDSMIWLQGEDNANLSTSKADYKTYLRNLHDQLLALAGLTRATANKFYFGVVVLGPGTTYAPEGTMGVIRAAQLEYVADPTNVGAYLAGVATDANLAGDQIHFINASERSMGARYAKSLALWAKGMPAQWAGPRITGATRSGTTVTITTTGGTGSLKDGAGGTGSGALGFRFFDAGASGAQIAITTTSITGTSAIQLTLASTPVGALTVDYAMANAPFGGTTAPASVIYDSDTVPGDTLGLPLQPCAAITVTGS